MVPRILFLACTWGCDGTSHAEAPASQAPEAEDTASSPGRPTGVPNAGDLEWTVEYTNGWDNQAGAVADLDQDGRDELFVYNFFDSQWSWLVLSIDAVAGTIEAGGVSGILDETIRYVGNGQIVLLGDQVHYLTTLTRDGGGTWIAGRLVGIPETVCLRGVGDLDGDGFGDVIRSTSGSGYEVVAGPLTGGIERVLLDLVDSGDHIASCVDLQTGDVDGDGANDLLAYAEYGDGYMTFVVTGPISDGASADSVRDLASVYIEVDGYGPPGLLWDLDNDGGRELISRTGWVFDGVEPGGARHEEDDYLPGVFGGDYAPGLSPVLAGVDSRGGAWWRYSSASAKAQPKPEAEIQCHSEDWTFGRFGSAAAIDFVCVGEVVSAVPGWGGLRGSDVDRDGFAGPDDCDDDDGAFRPGALDVPDGQDNDCDGTIDELRSEVWTPSVTLFGSEPVTGGSGSAMVALDGGWVFGERLGDWDAEVLYEAATGTVVVGPRTSGQPAAAGDFDGDSYRDVSLSGCGVLFGPAESITGGCFGYLDTEMDELFPLSDLNGDGASDLWYSRGELDSSGYDYDYWEGIALGGQGRPEKPDIETWQGPAAILSGADLDGDGYGDLVLADLTVIPGPHDFSRGYTSADVSRSLHRSDGRLDRIQTDDFDADGTIDVASERADGGVDIRFGPLPLGGIDLAVDADYSVPGSLFPDGIEHIWSFDGMLLFVVDPQADGARGRAYGFDLLASPTSLDEASVVVAGDTPNARLGNTGTVVELSGSFGLVLVAPDAHGELYSEGAVYTFVAP